MRILELSTQILTTTIGCTSALASVLLFVRLRWPAPLLWIFKLYVSAYSRWFVAIGILCIISGVAIHSPFNSLTGVYVFLIFSNHVFAVTRPPDGMGAFDNAFGKNWTNQFKQTQRYFISARSARGIPKVPEPILEKNVTYGTVQSTGRKLLCDVWRPNPSIAPSGLAFIYMHGSAWYLLDKDCGTRPFFKHLTAQGHVVMDVAYRLVPETDFMGMIMDVKRSIIWMKEHATAYGIDSDCIVVGGGSAGAHLALMAAYTFSDSRFFPIDLQGSDDRVCGVISFYGPADLKAMYYHTNQHLTTRKTANGVKKNAPTQMPAWIKKTMGQDYHRLGFDKGFEQAGALTYMLGGAPDERPEEYELLSPLNHVHADCPPTLLIHGDHDVMAPVSSTHELYAQLNKKNVSTAIHIFPQTDHAFDLVSPAQSPATHGAWYDVDMFLALLAYRKKRASTLTLSHDQFTPAY